MPARDRGGCARQRRARGPCRWWRGAAARGSPASRRDGWRMAERRRDATTTLCSGRAQQQRDERDKPVAHLATVDDHIDCAVLDQELGTLEALRQRLLHRLLD